MTKVIKDLVHERRGGESNVGIEVEKVVLVQPGTRVILFEAGGRAEEFQVMNESWLVTAEKTRVYHGNRRVDKIYLVVIVDGKLYHGDDLYSEPELEDF